MVRELAKDSVLKLTEVLAGFGLSLFPSFGREVLTERLTEGCSAFPGPAPLRTRAHTQFYWLLRLCWLCLLTFGQLFLCICELTNTEERTSTKGLWSLCSWLYPSDLEQCPGSVNTVIIKMESLIKSILRTEVYEERDHVFLCLSASTIPIYPTEVLHCTKPSATWYSWYFCKNTRSITWSNPD